MPEPRTLAPPEERGRTTVADRVVERVASISAHEVEAVIDTRAGWTKLVRRGLPRASAVVAGGRTRIEVEVAATWTSPLPQVAAQVRDHVSEQVQKMTGIDVAAVDVTVADVVRLPAHGGSSGTAVVLA